MDLNIFKEPDRTGKLSRLKYLSNNFPDEYNYIIDWCDKYNLNNIPLKEKIYLCTNNFKEKPLCDNPNCDNETNFKNRNLGYFKYCSNKCIGTDPKIIKKKEEKSIKKFGTKSPSKSEMIKDKIIKTNNQKYGFNSPMCNEKIKNKSKKTLKKNWGVDNPSKNKVLLDKRISSFKKNIKKYKENYKKTSLKRYNSEHPWSNNLIHQKSVENTFKVKNKNLKESVIKKIKKYDNLNFIDIDFKTRMIILNCINCKKEFKIHREYFSLRYKDNNIICTNCNPLKKHISGLENDLYNFIKNKYGGEIIKNNRSLLNKKEIDIFIPELNIAFEFNGLYWHSEINKPKKYHLNKTKECYNKGVELIHIWEDDWKLKKDIIKSIISNKLNVSKKVWARKCKIKKVNIKDSKKFLDENHIQGSCNSKIKIGLYKNDELISIMCFSKPRSVDIDDIELIRFCNKKNISVIGGASKLLKYFLKKYKYNKIISFSDTSLYSGKMYQELGFYMAKELPIDYKWVFGEKRNHKSKFKKQNLLKMGYDINKSEKEIMYEDLKSYRIWGCGLKKWIYKVNN